MTAVLIDYGVKFDYGFVVFDDVLEQRAVTVLANKCHIVQQLLQLLLVFRLHLVEILKPPFGDRDREAKSSFVFLGQFSLVLYEHHPVFAADHPPPVATGYLRILAIGFFDEVSQESQLMAF